MVLYHFLIFLFCVEVYLLGASVFFFCFSCPLDSIMCVLDVECSCA